MAQGYVDALSWVPKSRNLAATFARALDYSKAQAHAAVTLEHLLLALVSDPDASLVLHASNVDLARLNSDVSTYLAGLQERQQTPQMADPVAGDDLIRIVEYASAAAQQSRRREINGAIVLAAIVGDGRSAAANMLRAQGLTFEEAIKALQRASAAAPSAAPAGAAGRGDAIMAPQPVAIAPADPRSVAASDAAYPGAPAPPAPELTSAPPLNPTDPRVRPQMSAPSGSRGVPASATDSPASGTATNGHVNGAAPQSTEDILAATRHRLEAARPGQQTAPHPAPQGAAPSPPLPQAAPYPGPDIPDGVVNGEADEGLAPAPPVAPSLGRAAPAGSSESQPPPNAPRTDPPRLEIPRPQPVAAPVSHSPEHAPPPRPTPPLQQPNWSPQGYPPQGPPTQSSANAPYPRHAPAPQPWHPRSGQGAAGWPQQPSQPPPYNSRPGDPRPSTRPPWPEPPPPPEYANRRSDFSFDDNIAGAPYPNPDDAVPRFGGMSASGAGNQPHSAQFAAGQLVENVPRSMTAGVPESVEVRIAAADLRALSEGLQGSVSAYRHDVVVTKAMSVRLRAPNGGFWIETSSPETQWIENSLGLMPDDFASWRWSVTPQRRGKARLQLVVSARTVGADGMVAETALPDQVIDVKVRINYGQTVFRWSGWIVAAVLGGALAKFGERIWEAGQFILLKIAGG